MALPRAIRLFEKTAGDLLVEVDPAQADKHRTEGRTVSHMNITIDVLWTAEEEAVRQADGQIVASEDALVEQNRAAKQAIRTSAASKLRALGLTDEEIEALTD